MDDVNQKKKMILLGIVCVGILAVVITIVLVVLQINEAAKLKVQVGNVVYKTKETQLQDSGSGRVYTQTSIIVDKQKNTLPFSVVTPEGNEYLNIKTFAEQFCGYVYNKGLYGGIPDESADKCHIVSKGEKVSFSANSNDLIKFLSAGTKYDGELAYRENSQDYNKNEEDEEILTVDSLNGAPAVIQFQEMLYASPEAIAKGFNMQLYKQDNTYTLYPLETMVDTYSKALSAGGYKLTTNFKNQRALYEGLAVCDENGKYCVVEFTDAQSYQKVISSRYDSIEYIQSIGCFMTGITKDGTQSSANSLQFGMNSPEDGSVIIPAEYDFLKLIDAKNNLYLTKKNERYGVVGIKDGKSTEIIDTIYQQIGLDSVEEYANQNITNKYILDDYAIVTKKNGRFGIYSKDGYNLMNPRYQQFGCPNPSELLKKANGSNVTANPTLLIPVKENFNLVVFQDRNFFGLLDIKTGSIVVQAYYTAIYSAQSNGRTQYIFHRVIDSGEEQLVTLDELKASRNFANYLNNHSGEEQSKEDLQKQSDKENAKMEKEDAAMPDNEGEEEQNEEDEGNEEEYEN